MDMPGTEAWITSAVEDKKVDKALLQAGSLRKVHTGKKLVVVTSYGVALELREKLKEAFDLVVFIEQDDTNSGKGLDLEDCAKVEGFSLLIFTKCVYLSPNTLVLRNCDEMFDKYENFAAFENDDGTEVNSSVYLFVPSLRDSQALRRFAWNPETTAQGSSSTPPFNFNRWLKNNYPTQEKLDEEYNTCMDLNDGNSKSLSWDASIINFGNIHPLDFMTPDGSWTTQRELGRIEKKVVDLCQELHTGQPGSNPNTSNLAVDISLQLDNFKKEPIAIVGMSFRLPGGNNAEEFWKMLNDGNEGIKPVPPHRWNAEHTLYPCKDRNVEAGFLNVPVDQFDPEFFGMTEKEAELMDPQSRLLHEVAWEALEDAMIDPGSLRGTRAGVFVGSWLQDYRQMLSECNGEADFIQVYQGSSIAGGCAALSNLLGVKGPSLGTESGCSSAIVAVDMACKSLRNQDSNLAFACGVNLLLHPFEYDGLSFILSPEGRCKTFDEGANGFARAEACAVLLLKRFSDATRDGDNIWGLIRGAGVTQEGVSKSFGTPTIHCESLAMELALKDAGVDPQDVSYVEAHGTGTPVGDPLEIVAITKAYTCAKGRSEPLVIGSVKTNVGHTESVSGLTGIIKVLLSMRNEKIPKHLNLEKLNPAINLEAIPAKIPIDPMPWPRTQVKARIAGVSSFGISGTDGHVIIQEPPATSQANPQDRLERPLHILKISAKSPESFQELLATYENLLGSKSGERELADIAHSTNIGRATFNHRAVIIAKDSAEAKKILTSKSFKWAEVNSTHGKLCLVFSGQSLHYPKIGAKLYHTSPVFREEFDKCDEILSRQYAVNLREVLWGHPNSEVTTSLQIQTSRFCIEYCLLKLWESWGVKPDYVMGHGFGEYAAAVASRILDFEDALKLVVERAKFIDSTPRGNLLMVQANKMVVESTLQKFKTGHRHFWIGFVAINSANQTILSGDAGTIDEFAKYCRGKSLKTTLLGAGQAASSMFMKPMLADFIKAAHSVKIHRPSRKDAPKYISCLEGKLIGMEEVDADYWIRHAMEPVHFMEGCKAVEVEGCSIFLEVGSSPISSPIIIDNFGGQSLTCLTSIMDMEDEWLTLLNSLGQLYCSEWKGQVDWKGFDRLYKRSRVTIPFYPFNRKSIWKELEGELAAIHPLVGKPIPTASQTSIFEKRLSLKNTSFALDHVIGNTVIFPGAGFLEMCLAGGVAMLEGTTALGKLQPQRPILLRSLRITSPLALYETGIVRLQTVVQHERADDEVQISVGVHRYVKPVSGGVGEWISHATAKIAPAQETATAPMRIDIDIPAIQHSWEKTDNTEFYEKLPEVGLRFGPKFRSLEAGWRNEKGMLAEVKIPEDNDHGYLIHPVIADAMIQATMLWTSKDKLKMKLQVPVQIEQFKWIQASTSPSRYIHCETNEKGKAICSLLDGEGNHLAQMSGVDFIETTVKLVEGMIQQQGTAMPKLWGETWKSFPGPLQCRLDLVTAKHVLSNLDERVADRHSELLAKVNDVGELERRFYANICNLTRLFFLNALHELGWEPKQGTIFTLHDILQLMPAPKEHIKRYCRYFLRYIAESGSLGLRLDGENEDTFYFDGPPPTQDYIDNGLRTVSGPDDKSRVEYQIVCETGKNLSQVLTDKIQVLALLFPEDPSRVSASQFYVSLSTWVHPAVEPANDKWVIPVLTEALNAYMKGPKATANPPILRVLEVGAGTGGFTKRFAEYLHNRIGTQFEIYFTDISPSFFSAAEKELEMYSKQIIFKKYNMDEDPLAQGLCPGYFDTIIACEVLHVAKDIRKTLRSLSRLLKPGGIFQIIETTQPDPRISLVFGLLEGYWQFEDLDFRPHHATLTPEKWIEALNGINCEQVVIAPAYNNVHSFISAITSSENATTDLEISSPPQYSWLICSHEGTSQLAEALKSKLAGVNRKVHLVQRPPTCTEGEMKCLIKSELQLAMEEVERVEGVIYMWGLPDVGVSDRDQSRISLPFLNLIQEISEMKFPPRLFVVTQGIANVEGCEILNPTAGTLNGMIRSVCNECTHLGLTLFDLSPDKEVINQVEEIFYNLWGMDTSNRLLAFRDNDRLGMKIISVKVNNNEPLPLPGGCNRFQILLPKTRLISDLEFGVLEEYNLDENEVEVKVTAVALNFRDLFTVLKPIPEFENFNSLGVDFAGVVTKLGSKVTKRKIGDRVSGVHLGQDVALPSHVLMDEGQVMPLPDNITFAEGVTLPAVFATAFLCLMKLAGMKKGDKVLIHTASGGVGLCAIQLAQLVGAEIFATAGSKRKQNYLRNLGIKHIFHSRTTHFGKEILEVTNGKGVDIVLNSITGEGFKEASLSALAKNGRFIEMSKLNVWTPEEVNGMRPDVLYSIVDLPSLERWEMEELVGAMSEYLVEGTIRPIAYERFDAVNIRGALNHLQKAKHIGKIVCVMPEFKVENSKITATTPLFNERSTYLVTGGLGGIGLEVVKWMLKCGAKHIAIVSRSPPKPEIGREIETWNRAGNHVETFQVDIGNYDECRELFSELKSPTKGFPQLRGVMHAAGVLSDATVENQTWDSFQRCYKAKVDGSWNLHDLTKDLLLEHFVLFSSGASSMGSPGQSNHAASNSFEDTLAGYRRSHGLAATTINWGNWGEVGVATELDFPGIRPISTSQGFLALGTFLTTQTSHLSVINIDSFALASKLFPSLKTNVDDKLLFGVMKSAVIVNSDEFWAEVDAAEGRAGKLTVLKKFTKVVLRNTLKMDQDEDISDLAEFQTLGIDSLMMLEMKNGMQNILGSRMTLTASQLKDCNNTEMLANRMVDILQGEEGSSEVILPTMEELRELIREDSILPEHIRPCEASQPVKDIALSECVLLTGATGVLGPYLLRELTRRPTIKKIYCLVRKAGNVSCRDRLLQRLKVIGLETAVDMTKVQCIEGDVTDDKFGLPDEEYNRLAAHVNVIINSAVRSDHVEKYYKAPEGRKQNIRNVNVKGIIRQLEFAAQSKLKHFYHASTFLCVTQIDEDGCISEDWQDIGAFDQLEFNVGYPTSKHISEQLVRLAVERGIPCKSFRFPAIGGDSKTGRCDYITNHVILRWLAYLKLKCMPDVPTPMVVLPVDVCAKLSLEVFFNPGAASDVYNMVNAEGLDQTLIGIAEELGIIIKPVSFPEFVEKLKLEEDNSPLGPFKKMYEEEGAAVVEHFQGNRVIMNALQKCAENQSSFFRSRKVPQLVAGYDKMELDSTEAVMRRDINFLKESGVFKLFGIK